MFEEYISVHFDNPVYADFWWSMLPQFRYNIFCGNHTKSIYSKPQKYDDAKMLNLG